MGMQIEGGTGHPYAVDVTEENQLVTWAVQETEVAHEAQHSGRAFLWGYYGSPVAADDNLFWLRNDSTSENLVIEQFTIGSLIASTIEVFLGTGTTANGTTVTGFNTSLQSGKVALATARGLCTNADAGGSTTSVGTYFFPASESVEHEFDGSIVLGYLDEISFNALTVDTTFGIIVLGFYTKPRSSA